MQHVPPRQRSSAYLRRPIALWDLKARRFGTPLWRLLGGHDPRVPAYAGGIDLDFPLDQLLEQTNDNLKKGFRAIKMKVGRPHLSEDLDRVRAMRGHLGVDFPLMVDANMRWRVDEAVRAAPGFQSSAFIGSKSRPFPTMSKATGELYATADCRS